MVGRWTAVACAALGGWLLGCGAGPTFVCSSDTQCGAEGTCEPNGGCSFPDTECPSGRRFAEFTPSAKTCVPESVDEGSSSGGSSSTTSTLPASATLEPGDTTTTSSDDTTTEPEAVTSASTSSTVAESSSEGSTGSQPAADFYDDFERPDSDDIGNGWIEKTPDGFALIDGGIRRVATVNKYPDNLVYRPEGDWLDAEATVELIWLDLEQSFGSPQCMLRTQQADINLPGSVTAYLLFINSSNANLMITRQIAGIFTQEHAVDLTAPVEVGPLYRFRLRVTGSDPVVLDGYLEQLVDGEWSLHTEVHGLDDTEERIAGPGTFAVGGHSETEHWAYESAALEILDE